MKRILKAVAIAVMIGGTAHATLYDVNRSFGGATLTGTLEIPLGNHVIYNQSPSPFTTVDLTLTVAGQPFSLDRALTTIVHGTGQFLINATPTELTFNTANADGANPADLVFSDNNIDQANNRYVTGWNAAPGFEAAYTDAGDVVTDATFPTVFGMAVVPEPSTFALVGLGAAALVTARRRE